MPIRRRRATAAAFLVAAVTLLAGCNKIKSRQEIKKGNEFFKAQQYQAALASYQTAAQLDPREAKLKKNIGIAYMALYQPGSKHPKDIEYANKAIENLKEYLNAHPEDRRAREFLVSMYLSTDRFDDAITFYQEKVKSDPKDAKAIGSLAAMYFKKGDFDRGMEWEQKLAAADPQNPEPYVMIGVQAWDRSYHYPDVDAATRGKIVDQGLAALETSLKIKPDNFDALTYMNLLYREKAKVETDPAKQQEYIANADKFRQQALELRKKSLATTPSAEPGK